MRSLHQFNCKKWCFFVLCIYLGYLCLLVDVNLELARLNVASFRHSLSRTRCFKCWDTSIIHISYPTKTATKSRGSQLHNCLYAERDVSGMLAAKYHFMGIIVWGILSLACSRFVLTVAAADCCCWVLEIFLVRMRMKIQQKINHRGCAVDKTERERAEIILQFQEICSLVRAELWWRVNTQNCDLSQRKSSTIMVREPSSL